MKKILSILALGVLLGVIVMPSVSYAQDALPTSCKITHDLGVSTDICPKGTSAGPVTCSINNPDFQCGLCCLLNTVYTVTNWIFFLMMALAVILIVIGGATYMLATGDAEKATKAKSIITFAIVGLAIALIARFVPPIVKFIMGVS